MLYLVAICLLVRIKQRFFWTHCIFTLTNHIFAEQYILVNCVSSLNLLCFMENLKYTLVWSSSKKINLCLYFLFLDIYLRVTVISLIPYYYQSYKIPNKKQTDFQNWSHLNSHYISMRRCSPVRILYVEKPHHCFVSSKILQPKIYLCSFYDLLLLLRTNYSVTMTSHQRKKKMTCVIFLLYFTLLSTEKSDMLFYYTAIRISFNRFKTSQ